MSLDQLDIPGREDDWLEVVWMPNGLPMFIADRDDVCDIVESMGFSIYYLLANHTVSSTVTTKNANHTSTTSVVNTTTAQMFKVVNNFIGRSVSKCTEALPESFIAVNEQALYTMPPIPWKLIEKLDEFFRLVDAQHGTESIVLLTYDTTKEGPDGWGVLVPDQTNTSVHCNYDPTSVIEHKPENALIVGSVHSHPKMAAYASGTDHNDQADFDGIHITFGWQKSVNNGATQYHIEMQMAGTTYTLKPEDVFENYTNERDPDPEVIEWSKNVKKVLPPQYTAGVTSGFSHQQSTILGAPNGTAQLKTHTTPAGTRDFSQISKVARWESFPDVWKTLGKDAIVVAEVVPNNLGTYDCPSCKYDLLTEDVKDGYCCWCTIPVIEKTTLETHTLDDIFSDIAYWCYQFNYSTNCKVYLWITNNGTENTLMPLTQGTLSEAIVDSGAPAPASDNSYYDDNYIHIDSQLSGLSDSKDKLLCCGIDVDRMDHCMCHTQIHPDDALDFDQYVSYLHIYTADAVCNSCQFYYDIRCPGYRSNLVNFINNRSIPAENYRDTVTGEGCDSFMPFTRSDYSESTYSSYDVD